MITSTDTAAFANRSAAVGAIDYDLKKEAYSKIKYGAIATGLYFVALIVIAFSIFSVEINPLAFATGLLPVAWALAGCIELVTGVPFFKMAERWDGLAGWQRGMAVLALFVFGIFLIFLLGMGILFVLDGSSRF